MNRISAPLDFDSDAGPGGYSRAVRVGATVHVSGATAMRPDRTIAHPGDPGGQARYALGRIEAALREVGAEPEHVVRTRMYVTDVSHWREVMDVHTQVFGAIAPATSIVGVTGLASPDFLVEIEADAIVE